MVALSESKDSQLAESRDFTSTRQGRTPTEFGSKYGPWALVTGASAGIGREFARQLAAEGLNLILASRSQNRLEQLAEDLVAARRISVRTVPVDLARIGTAEALEEATADLDIGLLINNAGVETHGAFLRSDLDDETSLLQLNVVRPMELAHVFGRKMTRRSKGGIVFVSSTLGYQSVPYFANYASSKAYILVLG